MCGRNRVLDRRARGTQLMARQARSVVSGTEPERALLVVSPVERHTPRHTRSSAVSRTPTYERVRRTLACAQPGIRASTRAHRGHSALSGVPRLARSRAYELPRGLWCVRHTPCLPPIPLRWPRWYRRWPPNSPDGTRPVLRWACAPLASPRGPCSALPLASIRDPRRGDRGPSIGANKACARFAVGQTKRAHKEDP